MNKEIYGATLRLFNAIPALGGGKSMELSEDVLRRCVQNGYVIQAEVPQSDSVLNAIEDTVGISGIKANASFHKSWDKVANSSIVRLVLEQCLHYFTTYGLESLGLYSEDFVYIPSEVLNIPNSSDRIPLVVIKALDSNELLEEIVHLASTGIALSEGTLCDIMEIVKHFNYEPAFLDDVENRELFARLCEYYQVVPKEPVSFLRYLVSNLTGETLLIKNQILIGKLEQSNGKMLDVLMKDAPENLGSIFLRYKPLFLAMKKIGSKRTRTAINRLRKDAVTMHKAIGKDYLGSVTENISKGTLDIKTLELVLEDASIFRKIRLAYALNYRLNPVGSIVHRVRNGRAWVKEFEWGSHLHDETYRALLAVIGSIASSIHEGVDGKVFYIPEHIRYALPATEKQFVGQFPSGTSVHVNGDIMAGMHWFNNENYRVDIDLKALSVSGAIGWDAGYRSQDRNVLFSGDIVDAPRPHGASEFLYVKEGALEAQLLMANYFNYQKDEPVENARIVVAAETPVQGRFSGKDYIVDPNNVLLTANATISEMQSTLGIVLSGENESSFHLVQAAFGNSISSRKNDQTDMIRKYLVATAINPIGLDWIISLAGGEVVREIPEEGEYVNLSPEHVGKTTIIDLLVK